MTKRQSEVLYHLLHGLSVKETAAVLSISPKTVEFHERIIYEKLKDKRDARLIKFLHSSRLGSLVARIYFETLVNDRT